MTSEKDIILLLGRLVAAILADLKPESSVCACPNAADPPEPTDRPGRNAADFPPGWKFFSPTQAQIVRLLLDGRARKVAAIAQELGLDSSLKEEMASLGHRNVVGNTPSGYVLNLAPGLIGLAREWLDR
jgi:hypothetical protein